MKDKYAKEIVRTLRQSGYESYFVGGCVRDMVMGLEPTDYDIATSARPEDVVQLFSRTEPIGARFGVILVIHAGIPFEVATFRSDEAYVDGRRPTGVVFTDAQEDVLRRDFTINGLLYDPIKEEVIDYVDGKADIERRVVRAIGNPDERFEEDKLRILRAIRFGARLGYSIEDATWAAVRSMASKITEVSSERIREELVRLLTEGGAARGIEMLEESGLRREILPELQWTPHLARCLKMIGPSAAADFAMSVLLHECDTGQVRSIVRRLRFSNTQQEHIATLVENQARFDAAADMTTAELKRFLRILRFKDHLELYRIRLSAEGGELGTLRLVEDKLADWSGADLEPDPLITGDDLIKLGMEPGPSFKDILSAVEDEQLEGRIANAVDALDFVRQRFGESRK